MKAIRSNKKTIIMKNLENGKLSTHSFLTRAELRLIVGGDPIELRPYDPYCDEIKENEYVPDCPCYVDTQCPIRRYMVGPPDIIGNVIPGSGHCVNGVCG